MSDEEAPTRIEGRLAPGQRVGAGRYTLIRFLGKGGMGVVWLARDERLEEDLALKFLPGEISHDAGSLADMRRETLKSRKLSHPNIIRIHDLFEGENEAPFISMEFIDGKALNTLKIEQPQRLFPWESLVPLVRQMCAALDYAHGQKIVHRDLKPGNMMVDSSGVLKLADFGLAASAAESMSRLSIDLGASGTPAYMSPQQMRGKPPKVADDIYSLGATLYELLASKPPFYSGDIPHQVREEPPTPLEERLADLELENQIPDDVAALVMACLAKEPEQRPPNAAAVAEWIGLEISSTQTTPILGNQAEVEIVDQEAVTVPADYPEQAGDEPEDLEDEPASRPKAGGAWKWGAVVAIIALAALLFPKKQQAKAPQAANSATAESLGKTIDLLPLVDVSKDALKGEWEMTDSKLISNPFTAANLQLPYRPPEEYDFHVTFSRVKGERSVEMILSKNGRSFVWSMGGFGNTRRGFYFVGQIGPKHEASVARGIESGRTYDVVVQVRNDAVRALVDGELAVEWPTDYKDFRLSSNWMLKDESCIGVGNDDGLVYFKQIEVREVTGEGEFIRSSPPGSAVDLMPLIDVKRDTVKGTWRKSNGELASDDAGPSVLQIPYYPPKEYDYRIEFTRKSGERALAQLLATGSSQFQFDWSGWYGDVFGFGMIGNLSTKDNESTKIRAPLETGRRYLAEIRIRKNGAQAWLDGELVTELKTDYSNVSLHELAVIPDKKALGLLTHRTPTVFHKIEVREVTGEGTVTRRTR